MTDGLEYRFRPQVAFADAEALLQLALFAVEGLVGRVRVCLESRYLVDMEQLTIRVDADGEVGGLLTRIFAAFLVREFGETAFEVHLASQPFSSTRGSR